MPRSPLQRPSLARPRWLLLLVPAAIASAGCGTPAIHAAEQGRFEGVRAMLSDELAHGQLSLREAVGFARAVARTEIAGAGGEKGVQRIREMRSCANEVESALRDRADVRDAVGAEAAMALVDAGLRSPGRYERWARTPPGGAEAMFRPLGARALVSTGDEGELRRRLIADPDEEVRRNALRAAFVAADPADTEAVLEAARVDPYPAAREQAIRAAGVLGGERVVLALKDLWPRADVAAREAIVDAWRRERSFESGGRRELLWVVDTERGPAAILAAAMLTRTGGASASAGVLERAIKDGPSADRVRAIELAPLSLPALRAAVLAAEADHDEAVAAAALVRRFESPAGRPTAEEHATLVAKLLTFAAGTGAASVTARAALARARVKPLLPILERDGAAADAKIRAEAGTALVVLGEVRRAALVAADPEPSVRATVACAILRDWTRR